MKKTFFLALYFIFSILTVVAQPVNLEFNSGNINGWTLQEGANLDSQSHTVDAYLASTEYSVMVPGSTETNTVPISMTSPLGGNFLRFGRTTFGGYTYKLNQTYPVNSASSLAFSYALVMEDGSHPCNEQAYFNFTLKDNSGNVIPGAYINTIVGGASCSSGDPSFLTFNQYEYRNWSTVSYDLSNYVGTNVTIEVLVSGCLITQSAHTGYAYIDASLCNNVFTPSNVTVNGNFYNLTQAQSSISICNTDTVRITAPLVGATSFSWTGGAINGLTTQSVSITQPGVYNLIMNKSAACSNTSAVTFSIGASPTVTASASPTITCPGAKVKLSATGASNYTWTAMTPGPPVDISYNPNQNVYPTVTTVYKLTGANAFGCLGTVNYTANVHPVPTLTITGNNQFCAGNSTTLTASGAPTYSWNTGATTSSIVVTPSVSTNYIVSHTTANGCVANTSDSVKVLGNVKITSNKPALKYCLGDSIVVTGTGALSYTWSTGATTNSITLKPTVTTTYTLSALTASCGAKQVVFTVTVNAIPVVTANSSPASGTVCAGSSAFLFGGGATTYTWTGGVTNNVSFLPTIGNTYTVIGTDANGCRNTASKSISVTANPVSVSVNPVYPICVGQSATLTIIGASSNTWFNSSTSQSVVVSPTVTTTYSVNASWSGCSSNFNKQVLVTNILPNYTTPTSSFTLCSAAGSGVGLNGNNCFYSSPQPEVTVSSGIGPGYFVVNPFPLSPTVYTINATNGCGVVSNTVQIIPIASPTLSVSGPTVTCANAPITFTASGADTYQWAVGVYTTTYTVNPASSQTYVLYGSNQGQCSSSKTISVTVLPTPLLTVNSVTACAGISAILTAAGATTYTWNTGATTNSIVVPPTSNTYTVSGVLSPGNGCVASKTAAVVLATPTSSMITVNSGTVCAGNIFMIQPSGASIYSYSNGSTMDVPTVASTYTVTGFDSNGCLIDTAISSVTVRPLPIIAVNSESVCLGSTFTMTPTGGVVYVYSTGGNTVAPTSSSAYTVTGADSFGCINTAVSNATVGTSFSTTVAVNSGTICNGTNFTISPSGASTYSYSSGSAVVSPSVTTDYTITALSSLTCATSGTAISSVVVNPTPTITVNSGTICSNENFTITPGGAITYTYSTGSNVVITPSGNTTVTVTGTDANGCEDNVGTLSTIMVNATPVVTASSTTSVVCAATSVQLNSGGADTYTWSTGATSSSVAITPTVTDTYTVTGLDLNNCSSTATVSVIVANTCQDVWPGDANSDGWADNLDILELGLHYLQTGASRPSGLSNSWLSHFAINWTGAITNGKNVNHSDCNGDGTINDDDTLAIFNNYGLTHAFRPNAQIATVPELSIVPDQASVVKGNWGSASIYLGETSTPVNDINGIAFTVNFDNSLIEPNSIWLEYPASFINTANQNLHFRKLDFPGNSLYTATTHTANNNVSGDGLIGILHYQILSALTTDAVLNLGLIQGNKSETSGAITPLTAGTGTLMAIASSVGVFESSNNLYVSISPNPTSGVITIRSKTELQKIELIAVTGQILLSEVPVSTSHILHLDQLANGVYFVNVYQNDRVVKREKIVLSR
ncbi:MAG: T9SS type A sorting domain-containing protein [Bacteroidota bacterium]